MMGGRFAPCLRVATPQERAGRLGSTRMSVAVRPDIGQKRAYDDPAVSDGARILVDRVWPRGVTRSALQLDGWMKDIAPSTELRKWFDHDPAKWTEFKERYFLELAARPDLIDTLLSMVRAGRLTLVFGAKDTDCNNAVALKELLAREAEKRARGE